MFNYFFGSDSRSLSYLKFLNDNTKNLSVVTTDLSKLEEAKTSKLILLRIFVLKIIFILNISIRMTPMKICQMHFV